MVKNRAIRDLGDGNTKTPKPKVVKKQDTQCIKWCFTVNNPDEEKKVELDKLLLICNKFAYQLEMGEEKTEHWQGYIELSKRLRFSQLKKLCPTWHFEKCRNSQASVAYCMKIDGRIDGPWVKGFRKPCRDPMQGLKRHPWQIEIEELIAKEVPMSCRTINWYWDKTGGSGKSTFVKSLCLRHRKTMVRMSGKGADVKNGIIEFMKDMSNELKIFVMDVPRTIEKYISYTALEEIKNGQFYSGKYEGGEFLEEKPHVIVFANFPPDMSAMTQTRWNIVCLDPPIPRNYEDSDVSDTDEE